MLNSKTNKSDFLKNVTTLITGTVLAQLIPILLQPVLSRIYTPEEFGTFTIYISIISMLAAAGNLKYEGAVILPESDKKASALVIGAVLVSFLFSVFWLIIFLLFGDQIISTFKFAPSIKVWLLVIPLGIFIISSSRVLNYWLIRKKAFRASSINKLARRSSEGVSQVGILYYTKYQGLIIGSLIGEFVNLLVSFKQSLTKKLTLKGILFKDIKKQLYRYKDFPIYSFLPSLMNSISLFLPAIIINEFYTLELTGQFGFSKQILSIPLAFVSVAISQVLVQKVAESSRTNKKIMPLILKTTLILSIMAIIGIVIMQLFGVELFKWLFGSNWETAGELTKILVFSYAIKFVVSPLTAVFTALEKIKISSIWQIGYFGLIFSLYFFKNLSIEEFLNYYIVIDLASYLIYYLLLLNVCRKQDNTITL